MDCGPPDSLSMGVSRQEYWNGLPCPSLGDLPDLGIELVSACVSCIAGRFFPHWVIWEALVGLTIQGQLPNNWQAQYSTSSPSQSKASRLHQPDSALALAGSVVYRPAALKHHERCRVSALEIISICILTRSPGDSCALWTQRLCSHQPDLQLLAA